jgi:hypothetical protein
MLPICVIDPIGCANPFLIAATPAIRVVATAPKPGINTPSLPVGSFTSMVYILKLNKCPQNYRINNFSNKIVFWSKNYYQAGRSPVVNKAIDRTESIAI